MWEGIFVGVATACIMMIIQSVVHRSGKKNRKEKEQVDALREGVEAILHDRIITICDKCLERGFVHLHNVETVDSMYKAYRKLGGNGPVTKAVNVFKQLPFE